MSGLGGGEKFILSSAATGRAEAEALVGMLITPNKEQAEVFDGPPKRDGNPVTYLAMNNMGKRNTRRRSNTTHPPLGYS